MERLERLNQNIREQEEQLETLVREKYRIQWRFDEERQKLKSTNSQIQRELDEVYQTTLQDIRQLTDGDWEEELFQAKKVMEKYRSFQEEVYHVKTRELARREEESLQENNYQYRLKEMEIEELYDERRHLYNER